MDPHVITADKSCNELRNIIMFIWIIVFGYISSLTEGPRASFTNLYMHFVYVYMYYIFIYSHMNIDRVLIIWIIVFPAWLTVLRLLSLIWWTNIVNLLRVLHKLITQHSACFSIEHNYLLYNRSWIKSLDWLEDESFSLTTREKGANFTSHSNTPDWNKTKGKVK